MQPENMARQRVSKRLGGHHSISRGGTGVIVEGKLFISTGLGGALKISHFITCLYRKVGLLEVNYLFHADRVRPKLIISKKLQPPPPHLGIEWWPPYGMQAFKLFGSRPIE